MWMVVEFFRIAASCIRKLPSVSASGFGGEDFADAVEHFALGVIKGEELEAVAQAFAVTDDGANFQRVRTEGQRNLKRNNFTGGKLAGKRGANAILTEFSGAPPTTMEFPALKHANLHAGINGEALKTACP